MARFKTLTKAQIAMLGKLQHAHRMASDAVYASEPSGNVPFSECYDKFASAEVRNAWYEAMKAVVAFEQEMINEGRGWRSNGHFRPY